MERACWGVVLVAAILGLLSSGVARAVPAFARREGVQCQMCHFRMPELNEDGHAYIRRGLREEPEEASAPGEAAEQPEQPAAATPRLLGEPLPLQWADYLTVMGHHMFLAERGQRAKFDAGLIDIWAGGPLDTQWSGLANPSLNIEEGGSDVEPAYGQFITHWGECFGSARFGQTLPLAILFNQGGPSMTLSTPVVLDTPGDTGSSWTPTTLLRGAEVGAVNLPRWNVYVGAGQPHLEDSVEDERHTDVYGSAEYLLSPEGNSLTAYGYWGKASLTPGGTDRRFDRAGLFANVYGPKAKGVAGYLRGTDRTADGRSLDSTGYFVLVEHLLSDRWAVYGCYDHLHRDLAAGGSEVTKGPAIGASWWAQTQVRLTLEAQFLDISTERSDRRLMMEFMWAL